MVRIRSGWQFVPIFRDELLVSGMVRLVFFMNTFAISCGVEPQETFLYMGVSKNRGTPKWMVYNGKPYEQMDDLGVSLFLETPIYIYNIL